MSYFIFLSYTPAILNEGQGHSISYSNVKYSEVHPHTKFDRNQSLRVRVQTHISAFKLLGQRWGFFGGVGVGGGGCCLQSDLIKVLSLEH